MQRGGARRSRENWSRLTGSPGLAVAFARWLVFIASIPLALAGCSDRLDTSSIGPGRPETSSSAEVAVQLPPSAGLPSTGPSEPLVQLEHRPLSFAPLVAAADQSVATVKAVRRGRNALGREGTISEGLGTAFVYDASGFLLTNHHVIEKATDIIVGFKDGRELAARVVGTDKPTDVAVLKVEATGLPALPLGDSDALLVGDWVVAIGNPFGLSHTVSAGILSAKGRTRDDVQGLDPSGYFDFLQTDASINPGNSGGPLLDLQGKVVGINSAIRANANNIGFAIPVNMVKQLIPMLLRDGKVRRSAIGVIVADLGVEQASRLGRPNKKGAWVKAIQGGGPADRAGIAVDDVIVSFEGRPVDGPNALRWYASIHGVGQTATVSLLRGSRQFDVKVTLGELPDQDD
jgi:serine protease Do